MVSIYSLLYEEVDIETVTEANPIASVIQGFHTRKILKGMAPEERKELGRFLRDKEFIEMSRQYHTSGGKRPYDMERFIRQRIDDPKLAKKITHVALDPKFDQARQRLVTKMLVPRDTLPKSDEPLKITPHAQTQIDKDAKIADRTEKITTWLRSATVNNPETKRTILVRSGLRADPESEVYKAALAALNAQRKTLGMRASPARKPASKNTSDTKPTSTSPTKTPSTQPRKITPPSYTPPSRPSSPSGGGFSFGGGGGFSGGGGGSSF